MQQGFPKMDAGAFHKRDVRPTASAETVAEPGY
jgi:hypothetical protein